MVQRAKAENVATTNAYASILKANIYNHPNCSVVIKNSHASYVADFKILVSNEEHGASGTWAENKTEDQLAGNNATVKYALNGAYQWVDVQAKANAANNQAILSVFIYASRGD
jgi:uncharacterized protein with LGFP repeats